MPEQVAVIVPAYNEEGRIAHVLRAIVNAETPTEIIVVSDGSVDRTVEVASRFKGVCVIELPTNQGKGAAMAAGVEATRASVVAFVDADLEGLEAAHVDSIIRPILANQCDMCVGVFRGGKVWSDTAQRISPYLSGQRAMRRDFFASVPFIAELRMGVEVALNTAAKRRKARVTRVVLPGVSNYFKEKKLGLVRGTQARAKMYVEIGQAMVRTRKRRPRRRWLKKDLFITPHEDEQRRRPEEGGHDADGKLRDKPARERAEPPLGKEVRGEQEERPH